MKQQTAIDGYMDEKQRFIEPVSGEVKIGEATIALEPVALEDAAEFLRLIDSIGHQSKIDKVIFSILQEETRYYFEGEMTSEDAAERVQNRVSTYLKE